MKKGKAKNPTVADIRGRLDKIDKNLADVTKSLIKESSELDKARIARLGELSNLHGRYVQELRQIAADAVSMLDK